MAQTISIIDVILAKALAISASKAYTDQKTQSLMGGVHYRGQVDYYDNLPNDPEEGDSYTVKYAGSSGTVVDGTEYTWGVDSSTNTMTWISFSKDAYSKAETDLLLAAKQSLIDASNKLDGSLVGPLTGYVAAVTAAALDPTDTLLQALGKLEKAADDNKNNISKYKYESVVINFSDLTFMQSASGMYYSSQISLTDITRVLSCVISSFSDFRTTEMVQVIVSNDASKIRVMSNTDTFSANTQLVVQVFGIDES